MAVTTSVTDVWRIVLPLVPVTVIGYVPAGVLVLVVIVQTEDPEPTTDVGAKVAVDPAGSPVQVNVTVPTNPPLPVVVIV